MYVEQLCIRLEKLRQESFQRDVICRIRVEELKVDIDKTLLGVSSSGSDEYYDEI